MDDNVAAALDRIPVFDGMPRAAIACTRLGGLTNLVYRVEAGDRRYLLRIAGAGTEAYIDRKVEGHNARVAAAAGVSAEVLHFDTDSGLMLARYLEGCVTMRP